MEASKTKYHNYNNRIVVMALCFEWHKILKKQIFFEHKILKMEFINKCTLTTYPRNICKQRNLINFTYSLALFIHQCRSGREKTKIHTVNMGQNNIYNELNKYM